MKNLLLIVALLTTIGLSNQANAGVNVSVGIGVGGYPYYSPYYGPPGAYYGPYGPLVYIGPGYYPWYHGYWHGGYCYRRGYHR
ncbi:MAG: hypothetical protein LV481_01190 [Methylacidiphilales bacterium]|nr:hypothetical protein [Candidatus Methylacidiphilales bacterium]